MLGSFWRTLNPELWAMVDIYTNSARTEYGSSSYLSHAVLSPSLQCFIAAYRSYVLSFLLRLEPHTNRTISPRANVSLQWNGQFIPSEDEYQGESLPPSLLPRSPAFLQYRVHVEGTARILAITIEQPHVWMPFITLDKVEEGISVKHVCSRWPCGDDWVPSLSIHVSIFPHTLQQ